MASFLSDRNAEIFLRRPVVAPVLPHGRKLLVDPTGCRQIPLRTAMGRARRIGSTLAERSRFSFTRARTSMSSCTSAFRLLVLSAWTARPCS